MSEAKHTPGPWKYAGNDAQGCDVYCDGPAPDERGKIADVMLEANAKLIAAAPDLLAALRSSENWHGELTICNDPDDGLRGLLEQMRSAITKATGE